MPGTLLTTQATLHSSMRRSSGSNTGFRMPGQSEPIMTYRICGPGASEASPEG